ncbi:MAG TPA: large conductance mechanosensitive channel protein MscL [Candidatus Paceibacterota bacterium]|nr:large conductance mechanosensitive channel protein MscL [Candidatus Paceibacterota bacterium]
MLKRTRGIIDEFRSFAIKGNAFELAIAVVIGTAFTAIVNSLVADIITPVIAYLTGSVDLKSLSATVRPDLVIKYGTFLQAIFNFLLISLSIFIFFKIISGARKRIFREGEQAIPAHEKPAQERLLEEIRDLLKEKN